METERIRISQREIRRFPALQCIVAGAARAANFPTVYLSSVCRDRDEMQQLRFSGLLLAALVRTSFIILAQSSMEGVHSMLLWTPSAYNNIRFQHVAT